MHADMCRRIALTIANAHAKCCPKRAVKLRAVAEVPSAASFHSKVGTMCGPAGPRATNQRVWQQQTKGFGSNKPFCTHLQLGPLQPSTQVQVAGPVQLPAQPEVIRAHSTLEDRIASQCEVIRAIVSDHILCCGVPAPLLQQPSRQPGTCGQIGEAQSLIGPPRE